MKFNTFERAFALWGEEIQNVEVVRVRSKHFWDVHSQPTCWQLVLSTPIPAVTPPQLYTVGQSCKHPALPCSAHRGCLNLPTVSLKILPVHKNTGVYVQLNKPLIFTCLRLIFFCVLAFLQKYPTLGDPRKPAYRKLFPQIQCFGCLTFSLV